MARADSSICKSGLVNSDMTLYMTLLSSRDSLGQFLNALIYSNLMILVIRNYVGLKNWKDLISLNSMHIGYISSTSILM